MKYYKVKPGYNNVPIFKVKNNTMTYDNVLIGNELYTVEEWEMLLDYSVIPNSSEAVEMVEIPKNKTFWSFGARFEIKGV